MVFVCFTHILATDLLPWSYQRRRNRSPRFPPPRRNCLLMFHPYPSNGSSLDFPKAWMELHNKIDMHSQSCT